MSETWIEQTTAFERVKSVALTVSDARTADWIAEEAHVSENTARTHLSHLAELGVLTTSSTNKGTTYAPDPIYTRSQDIRELVQNHTEDQLASHAVDLQADIDTYRTAYEADSPAALRVSIAESELSPTEARNRLETASDWEYARYRLSLVRDALDHYDTYTSRRSASA